YERLFDLEAIEAGSIAHAVLAYLQRGMLELKPATQKHYHGMGRRLLHHFGHLQLHGLEPTHCAQFLKWCRENQRATTGNREKAFMSSVWEFALSEDWCQVNPWRGVRRNKERPSRRYI